VLFCSNGKLDIFLDRLVEIGFDGFMPEIPATDFSRLLEIGKSKVIIDGIDTGILTRGSSEEVFIHTHEVLQKTIDLPGFFISSPGDLWKHPYGKSTSLFPCPKRIWWSTSELVNQVQVESLIDGK